MLKFWSVRVQIVVAIFTVSLLQVWWSINSVPLHADLLYLESIYRDVIFNWRNPRYFIFTEAFFLFPDGLVYFLLRFPLSNATETLIAYCFVCSTLYWSLLYVLFQRVWLGQKSLATFFLSALIVVALSGMTPTYLKTAFWPNHHGALQVFFLTWLDQLIRLPRLSGRRLWQWVALDFVLTFLLCASDMVAAPTIFAPASLVFLIWFVRGRPLSRKFCAAFAGAHVLGIVLAFFGLWGLFYGGIASGVPLNMEVAQKVWASVNAFPRSLPLFLEREWITLTFIGLVVGYCYFTSRRTGLWWNLFLKLGLSSLLLTIATVILTGRWPAPEGFERYLQQILYLPLLGLMLWGIPNLAFPAAAQWALSLALILGIGVENYFWEGDTLTEYPALTACLDHHAKDLPTPWGLARFYPAKLVTFTSLEQIQLNQVKRNLSAYPWQNSLSWYSEDIYGRTIDRTTFYLAQNHDDATRAVLQWGLPERRFTCPNLLAVEKTDPAEVMIYPNGLRALPIDGSPND